jgi:hypothetical protein
LSAKRQGTELSWVVIFGASLGLSVAASAADSLVFKAVAVLFLLVAITSAYTRLCSANEDSDVHLLRKLSDLHSLELSETVRILKAQRHDYVNHLQVIFGMLQTDKVEQIPEYIRRANREINIEEQLNMLSAGEFRHIILASKIAARGSSIEMDLNVAGAQAWPGFRKHLRERNLFFRLLLHNLMDSLSFDMEIDKRIRITITPEQTTDVITVHVFPAKAVHDEKMFGLPKVVQDLLGKDRSVNIETIWEQVLGGEIAVCRCAGDELQITLSSPH